MLLALAACGSGAPADDLTSVGDAADGGASIAGDLASETEPAAVDSSAEPTTTTVAPEDDVEPAPSSTGSAETTATDDSVTTTSNTTVATTTPVGAASASTTSSSTTVPPPSSAPITTTSTTTSVPASTSTTTASAPAAIDWLGNYELSDPEFGTSVSVTLSGGDRTITTNALPDHETGTFPGPGNPNPISAQSLTYVFPESPTFTGAAVSVRTPGVALNGVRFAPNTAETVTCGSGEEYKIEGIQDTYNLGLDVNQAHVQPTGEYHYHGISPLLVDAYESGDDLVLVGFASDGHLIWYSKSGAYDSGWTLRTTPRTGSDCVASLRNADTTVEGTMPDGTYSSDWEFTGGDLDECNGATIGGEYAYVITETYPYISRCLNGDLTGVTPNVVNRRG